MVFRAIDPSFTIFESEDIFLLGFSQGGCIAFETYYRYPEKLGGVIGLSPRLYLDKLPSELISTPLFIAHGKNDEAINFNETLENAKKLKSEIIISSFMNMITPILLILIPLWNYGNGLTNTCESLFTITY